MEGSNGNLRVCAGRSANPRFRCLLLPLSRPARAPSHRETLIMHGFGYPVASHVEKLIPKFGLVATTRKPHALTRVTNTFLIGCGHDGASRREHAWSLSHR